MRNKTVGTRKPVVDKSYLVFSDGEYHLLHAPETSAIVGFQFDSDADALRFADGGMVHGRSLGEWAPLKVMREGA